MQVLAIFGWMAICGLVAWRTSFQMPEGYGTAMFLLQFAGGIASAALIGAALPSAIDPSYRVVETGRNGNPNYFTTWSRKKALRRIVIGATIFIVTNVGGWIVDVVMGLPERYERRIVQDLEDNSRRAELAAPACLAKTWSPPMTCMLRYRASAGDDHAELELEQALCGNPAIEACMAPRVDVKLEPRKLDSLRYAGARTIVILHPFRGTAPSPPAERP